MVHLREVVAVAHVGALAAADGRPGVGASAFGDLPVVVVAPLALSGHSSTSSTSGVQWSHCFGPGPVSSRYAIGPRGLDRWATIGNAPTYPAILSRSSSSAGGMVPLVRLHWTNSSCPGLNAARSTLVLLPALRRTS